MLIVPSRLESGGTRLHGAGRSAMTAHPVGMRGCHRVLARERGSVCHEGLSQSARQAMPRKTKDKG